MEKTTYDTYNAYMGRDLYTEEARDKPGVTFPSGGAALPSFSLIPVRKLDSTSPQPRP
jgi:hypothetical protein